MPYYRVEFFEKGGWSKFGKRFSTLNDAMAMWNRLYSTTKYAQFAAHRFVWCEDRPHNPGQIIVFDAQGPSFNEFERRKVENVAV